MTGPNDHVTRRSAGRLRDLWTQDRPAVGVWSSLADTSVAELLAATDFDYLCVDLQHGLATFRELPGMLQAMRAADRAPVVRVPWNDPASVMRAVDTGAAAVIVPMVNSAQDARLAASACRFPPTGSRSWGPMWGDVRADGALPPQDQDDAVLCVVMVETRAGVDAIDEIVAVPGVDAVYIGPHDLALGCGHGRGTYRDSAEVDALIQGVVDACLRAGVVAGLHCSDVEMAVHWAGRGVRMLTAATDTTLLRRAADQARDAVAAGLVSGQLGSAVRR
jgi:4-hydroxy-2-oxoheptanedioate aldolase